MKRIMRILVGVALGAALASYVSSGDGRQTLGRIAGRARDMAERWGAGGPSAGTPAPFGSDGGALEAKIAETRRRLEEQLRARLSGEDSV